MDNLSDWTDNWPIGVSTCSVVVTVHEQAERTQNERVEKLRE
jgi:hypothetical protein